MSAPCVNRLVQRSLRSAAAKSFLRPRPHTRAMHSRVLLSTQTLQTAVPGRRCLSISTSVRRPGIMPDTEDPQRPARKADPVQATQPAELSDEEYHQISEDYMNNVHEKAELLQESRDDVEVEYSAGVLSIVFPPHGTYVVNKQPPNKQIWLSSPLSGPKRYDWVVSGESMHQKEGGGQGEWIYLRDGTKLSALLNKELGISLVDPQEELLQESRGPVE